MRKILIPVLLPATLLFAYALSARTASPTTPPISGFLPLYETGKGWAEREYATGVAFGDVDGDGRDEFAITRNALSGPRLLLVDDAAAGFALLWTFGQSWGAGAYATSVAMGDVDGDGRAEIGLTRATSVNERAFVFDDAAAGFALLTQTGGTYDPAVHAIRIAFGDADGDGRDEFAVATNAASGPRVFVFGSAATDYAPQWDAGADWGVAAIATSVAFGDVDGDGAAEVGITRRHDSNARVFLHNGADGALVWSTGQAWGAGAWATDIAFGNVDGDAAEEMGLARKSAINERALVLDDAAAGYAPLARFGETWNENAYATAIAFGDADGDGVDEVGLAREATVNPRFYVYDDAIATAPFREIWGSGERWPGEDYATTIAFGQIDDAPGEELGVGRRAEAGSRVWLYGRAWTARIPFISGEPTPQPTPAAR